ncbi:MAG: MBOAT family protein [Candidatus Syntrophosphaera sp.]|nr:MBOAT family protein [Candidatus Syntrophosphaera sp.]
MSVGQILQVFGYDPQNPLIFNSGFFLFFFIAVMLFYPLVVSRVRVRTWYLLIFSLYFYYKTSGGFVLMLLVTAGINFLFGGLIAREKNKAARSALLWINVLWNLGFMGYFKYTNFVIATLNQVFGGSLPLQDIILPVGISFFTFQAMSYTLDIYFGKLKPVRNFADFAFFVSIFPQLVAGPILRASWFIPQINKKLSLSQEQISKALILICAGLIKKGVIADYISINFVDRVFDNPALFSGVENLIAVYGYGLQIYCDFSGYSDIAIGLATLLGFKIPPNFNSPYRAASITDFWRRWHISLSSWLRDYLYIPLGGNRKGRFRTYVNLMATMLLGGLWHGASWNFVFWGGLHGAALALDKLIQTTIGRRSAASMLKNPDPSPLSRVLGLVLTFNFVSFAWIFFRSRDFASAWLMLSRIFTKFNPRVIFLWLAQYHVVAALIVLGYLFHWVPKRFELGLEERLSQVPVAVQAFILAIVIWILFQFRAADLQPFIYFQF